MKPDEPIPVPPGTATPCPVRDCFRTAERWPIGPVMCIPHRAHWAAEHQEHLSPRERQGWQERFTFAGPKGETYCTWPDNFGRVRR